MTSGGLFLPKVLEVLHKHDLGQEGEETVFSLHLVTEPLGEVPSTPAQPSLKSLWG